MERDYDKHHVFACEYKKCQEARILRGYKTFQPLMEYDYHHYDLHVTTRRIPLLGHFSLHKVINDFDEQPSTLSSIDLIMLCIDRVNKHHNCPSDEKGINNLVLESLDQQTDYFHYSDKNCIYLPVR